MYVFDFEISLFQWKDEEVCPVLYKLCFDLYPICISGSFALSSYKSTCSWWSAAAPKFISSVIASIDPNITGRNSKLFTHFCTSGLCRSSISRQQIQVTKTLCKNPLCSMRDGSWFEQCWAATYRHRIIDVTPLEFWYPQGSVSMGVRKHPEWRH